MFYQKSETLYGSRECILNKIDYSCICFLMQYWGSIENKLFIVIIIESFYQKLVHECTYMYQM